MRSDLPCARRTNLVVQNVDSELLLFDTNTYKANVLNRTAALVWQNADGKSTIPEIAAHLSRELASPVDQAVVWYSLQQLAEHNLLESPLPGRSPSTSRRDFLRAGLVGAAVVLPVIVTMTTPRVSNAASCVASGQPCTDSSECCSDVCAEETCL